MILLKGCYYIEPTDYVHSVMKKKFGLIKYSNRDWQWLNWVEIVTYQGKSTNLLLKSIFIKQDVSNSFSELRKYSCSYRKKNDFAMRILIHSNSECDSIEL